MYEQWRIALLLHRISTLSEFNNMNWVVESCTQITPTNEGRNVWKTKNLDNKITKEVIVQIIKLQKHKLTRNYINFTI